MPQPEEHAMMLEALARIEANQSAILTSLAALTANQSALANKLHDMQALILQNTRSLENG